ncbi:SusC/RagA family TonB-linked outer membrane protein [Longitalea arenae]|uniref:SusC/RagA family TonB-linked outer membrane protein n=1 Tax=Longitalea arenae TaxID=2812558 RepID=UPI001967089D|nr:SusC/RagA family TonB-linked outer membrane protein [Longitalea arenae]
MKTAFLIILVSCLQVTANGLAQEKITLSVNNASLEQVLKSIRTQTGYIFIYETETVKDKKVTLHVSNASLKETLDKCFQHLAISYVIAGKNVVINAKNKTTATVTEGDGNSRPPFIDVRGTVVNEKKEPVAGVTVTVKGTQKNTLTDSQGEFSLSTVENNAVLVFTHISMETFEISVSGKTELAISLKTKIRELSDVTVTVNTGYQQLPKERATGSFDVIDNKTFNQQVSTNILGRLEAISNGLTVDRVTNPSGRLMVRGLSTILGPKDPLIIVDNFPYEGDINNINPNDVENITVLKDAAASSIWGSRAGNGVIVITTKKSKLNQRLSIEFNSNLTVTDQPDLSYIKQISSADFIDAELFLFQNRYRFSDTSGVSRPLFSPVYEILFQRRRGTISAADSATQIDALRNIDIRNDFDRYLYRKAVNQQYSINMKGGSNNYSWFLSSGFDHNIDQLNAKYDRINLRFQNMFSPVKGLQIQAGIYYTQTDSKNGRPGYGNITSLNTGFIPPYTQLADEYGTPLRIYKDYRTPYIDTAGAGKLLDWTYTPLDDYRHNIITSKGSDALINLSANYEIIPGLSALVQYQYEKQQINSRNLYDEYSYTARNMVNRYSQIDASGKVTYIVPKGGILDLSSSVLQSSNVRAQLNYTKNWNKHAFAGILGAELRELNTTESRNRLYGYNDNTLTFGMVDYTRTYPEYISKNSSFIQQNDGLLDKTNRFVSVFSNIAYTYLSKYTISASVRRDGSNLYGANINDKWKPLWSVGGSWDLSRESFYKSKLLPYLKARVTYGFSGNADPSKVALTTIQYLFNSQFTLTPVSTINNFDNPELKWETVRMTNMGLDFGTLNNRVSGSLDYYMKKGTDLFAFTPVDYTSVSVPQLVRNVAEISGKGFDLKINSKNIDGVFKWASTLNLSYYSDKVNKYYQSSYLGKNFITSDLRVSAVEGNSVYSIYSYRWAGLDSLTGDPRGYLNKQVSKDYNKLVNDSLQNLVHHGPALPRVFGSLINTFSWKQLSLSVALMYKFNYYFRKPTINYNQLYSSWVGHADISNRWRSPGDEQFTNVPSMIYPGSTSRDEFYAGSEANVVKGDHIRLQYITLNYFLDNLSKKQGIFKGLQVYLNVNNLGVIWRANKLNIDPEYYSQYAMPPAKSFSVGVRTNL